MDDLSVGEKTSENKALEKEIQIVKEVDYLSVSERTLENW